MFSAETVEIIARIARNSNIEPATLLSVVEVESAGKAYASVRGRKEPLIRFEGHYFDRRVSSHERKMAREAGLASPTPGAIRNPPTQSARWRLLERAAAIDRTAAYEATSWGVGQVMGAHWAWLGYANVEVLVDTARSGLEGQLSLMLRYIEKAGLSDALRHRDWTTFARGYSGPGFARNSYHLRLSLAYRRHTQGNSARGKNSQPEETTILRRGDRGDRVRHLQRQLLATGYPVTIDGIFGPETQDAVKRFQRRNGLAVDGAFGPKTRHMMKRGLPATALMHPMIKFLARLWRWISASLMHWKI